MAKMISEIKDLVGVALNARRKRAQISSCLKKNGFLPIGKGCFLGVRNKDIVSGLIVDAPPFNTYMTAFILPGFDKSEVITYSLGERIFECDSEIASQLECQTAIEHYREAYSNIKSVSGLVEHIERRGVGGYSTWAMYICYLRQSDIDSAVNFLDEAKRDRLHPSKIEKVNALDPFVSSRDVVGIGRIFNEWSAVTERIFGPLDQNFDVFSKA